ncbi:DUF4347 domain-containing protein [Acaryochloris marina]|uniref:DUF4347 domain-containing protein n=1 Tax=Acaryochloris marina (strain MBIC 11017) TaxID=329726 RepID=A8ZN88_ACAM1|nr:DUF4347 domain-containing protein [Acaryochloris marina]ABW32286.1 conserved hypothetical protein [Acaryochloris marina MBIC11017]
MTTNLSTEPTFPINFSQSTPYLVVVDTAIDNYQYLLASPLLGREVHILDIETDGIAQIKTLLSQFEGLSCLHLICKGGPDHLELGTTRLDVDNLWDYADEICQWQDYLTEGAEIFIYGCELAASRLGQAFVSWLGLLIGATVRTE